MRCSFREQIGIWPHEPFLDLLYSWALCVGCASIYSASPTGAGNAQSPGWDTERPACARKCRLSIGAGHCKQKPIVCGFCGVFRAQDYRRISISGAGSVKLRVWQRKLQASRARTERDRTHALYRFFDSDGALLYVGISCDPGVRFRQHRRDVPWWQLIRRIELEPRASRDEALSAEREAIRTERPRYNVHGGAVPASPNATAGELVDLVVLMQRFGFSERWWRYRIAEGLPVERWGNRLRFDPVAVRKWLNSQGETKDAA